jgi:hypothetical protein
MKKIRHDHHAAVALCRTILIAGHFQAEAACRATLERLLPFLGVLAVAGYIPAVLLLEAAQWVLADLAPANNRIRHRDTLFTPAPAIVPVLPIELRPANWPVDADGIPLARVAPATPAPIPVVLADLATNEIITVRIELAEVITGLMFAAGHDAEVYGNPHTPPQCVQDAPESSISAEVGHVPLPDDVVPITHRIALEDAGRGSTPSMPKAKASPDRVRQLLAEGKSQREVARELGVSQSTVLKLARRSAA